MKIIDGPFEGTYIIDIEPIEDGRGFFARTLCKESFSARGIHGEFVQQSISWNPNVGTVRGIHYQKYPYEEEKLVRVTSGAIYDVLVDLRRQSLTFGQWYGLEISAANHRQVFIPKGIAHGFQTTLPNTEVLYEMTIPYQSTHASGIRWDDSDIGIKWPIKLDKQDRSKLSIRDSMLPCLKEINDK